MTGWRRELRNFTLISCGAILLSLGVALFLAPNRIATGGTPGMAILFNYLIGLPIGLLMLLINLPLLLAGWRMIGRAFAGRSIVAILIMSLLIDFSREVLQLTALSHETLLATLYGGIAVGGGVGLILRGNASAGGTMIIARLISSRTRFTSGQVLLTFDCCIIAASALIFQEVDRALWSFISIYATAKCVDLILTGAVTEKVVHITSGRAAQLSRAIVEELGPNGTIIRGEGLQAQSKNLIFLTVEARKLARLREIVKSNDAEAFMVVMDAAELLGRGHGI
jgi:uncharacterized membrane-anchored protein YitT (DUF2179 family)